MGTVADIHQGGFHIRGVTVVGEADRVGRPVAQQQMLRPHLPQSTSLDLPAQIRTHQPVLSFSIDGELLALDLRQSVLARPLQNELRGLVKLSGGGHAMQASQVAQIFIRRRAAGFIAQLDPLFRGKKWLLGERESCGGEENETVRAKRTMEGEHTFAPSLAAQAPLVYAMSDQSSQS